VFFSPAPDYLLKVQGDSMIDEGIFDGDLIGVHRTRDAHSGQIVVARIDDEITVKLLKIAKDRIRLVQAPPVEKLAEPDLPDSVLRLPVLGRVAAGLPIGADIGSDDFVVLDRVFFSPAPDYLLKVQGDSMIDEGIFDGALIGVLRTRDAHSGQIVVARIDDEITVKLLKIAKDRIRLLPRNPDYKPIEVLPDQDFAIEGLYCGLLRPNR